VKTAGVQPIRPLNARELSQLGAAKLAAFLGAVVIAVGSAACNDATGLAGSGRPIVFMQHTNGWKLYQVGLIGSKPQTLPARLPAIYPAVSPDGQFVAYVHEAADGGVEVVSLRTGGVIRPYLDAAVEQIAWSPAQDRLVLALPFWGAGPGAGGLRVLKLSDSSTQDIAPDLIEPAWSPDGNTILAVSGQFGTREPGIYALNPDGTNIRLVVSANGMGIRGPAWSPDGSRIAFSRGTYGAHFIYTARPDGSDERRVTYPDSTPGLFTDLKPAWSPDGSWIAFTREHAVCPNGACVGRYDIFAVRVDILGFAPSRPQPRNLTRDAEWGGAFPSW
jgi:hypothetical protein